MKEFADDLQMIGARTRVDDGVVNVRVTVPRPAKSVFMNRWNDASDF